MLDKHLFNNTAGAARPVQSVSENVGQDRLIVRGRIEKSDEVRTTDSVIIHLIWPIEELDIRSMSL